MENIYQNQIIRSPIAKALVLTLITATLLGSAALTNAAPKEKEGGHESNSKAYGHLVAPGYSKNFGWSNFNFSWLPPGIAKKLSNWHPGVDKHAPVINGLTVTDTDSTATVVYATNEKASGTLFLSTVSPVMVNASSTIKVMNGSLSFHQTLTATNLIPNTEYFGIVTATDKAGNTATSSPFSLTTSGTSTDVTGPIVSGITVDATTTAATIDWDTNEQSTSIVYYSLVPGFSLDATTTTKIVNPTLTENHIVTLPGLTASTTYYFAVASVDTSSNTTTSAIASFTTDALADVVSPVITDVIGVAGTSTIIGSWTTNEPATSALYTSTSTGFGLTDSGVIVTENLTLTLNHMLTITGLSTSTTYYHKIVTKDAAGNETISAEFTFGTINYHRQRRWYDSSLEGLVVSE